VGGGGARSALWQRSQADVYKQPVELIDVDEGAAFGAAILAGVGVGAWNTVDEACDRAIHVSKRLEPDTNSAKILDRNYAAYRLLYNALRPINKIFAGHEREV